MPITIPHKNIIVPIFSAYAGALTSIPAGTWTRVAFNSVNFDVDGSYDEVTNYRFTPKVAGKYLFTGSVMINGLVTTVATYASIRKNGVGQEWIKQAVGGDGSVSLPALTTLEANGVDDYFELWVYHADSVSRDTVTGSATYFQASLINPALSVGAGREISFSANRITSSQTLPASASTVVQFNGEKFDEDDNYDSVTNFRFTAPQNGRYQFNSCLYFLGLPNPSYIKMYIRVNGTDYKGVDADYYTQPAVNAGLQLSSLIDLAKGDYVEVLAWTDATGVAIYFGDFSFFSGHLIK